MRPVRFVALSEDGQALVLADEVGRLLALPIDDRITGALHAEPDAPAAHGRRRDARRRRRRRCRRATSRPASAPASPPRTSPASPACRSTGCCATPARCCRSGPCSPSTPAAPGCKTSDKGAPLAEVVDGRLAQHGIDTEKISWDAYRREDGTWRIVATWPSGKATAQAIWELDKARQVVAPHDDMAQYLCAERPTQILGQDPVPEPPRPRARGHGAARPGRAASRAAAGTACRAGREPARPARDPIRAGRDALLASLDRPLGHRRQPRASTPATPATPPRPVAGGAARAARRRSGLAPSTTTPTCPRRCRPCRRWRCCGPAARSAGRQQPASRPREQAAQAPARAGTTCSSAAPRRPARPPDRPLPATPCTSAW